VADRTLQLPRPIGFVLGGGASLGAVQVGMLRALADQGVQPDSVTGTSVGALNGAVLAADPRHGLDRLTAMWGQLQRSDVFPGNVLSLAWRLGRSRTHVVEATGLGSLVGRSLDVDAFEELAIPLAVVAVDLGSGREVRLESGPLLPALLASAAIPGLFPSVTVGGRRLVDGGVTANVPVGHALAGGARSLVVLDTTVPAPVTPGEPTVASLLARVNQIQLRAQLLASLPPVASRVPVVCLPAPGPRRVSPLGFDDSAVLIQDAFEQARSFLADLQVDGPGIYGDPFTRYLAGEANATTAGLATAVTA